MRKNMLIVIAVLMLVFLLPLVNGDKMVERVYAWDDCPKGLINDKYPGNCPLYIDTDGNGICDRSEPAPENRIGLKNSNQIATANQAENPSRITIIAVLSILVPFTILIGYAWIYKPQTR